MFQQRGRGASFCGIETHIEIPSGVKAEATMLIGELIGGEAKIKQHAIDTGDAEIVEHLERGGVACVNELYAVVIKA